MPKDALREGLRKPDPERIYLEPAPYSPEGRLWCEDDVWPLAGDGPSGVEYVRADLVCRELEAPDAAGGDVAQDRADRDALGRVVREAWIAWAREQPDPKPSWLVPYDDLDEADREAGRRIGEAVAAVVRREVGAGGEECGRRSGAQGGGAGP